MPATATGVLNVARKELGYAERPGNRTKYGRWYGLDGGPWCAIWVSWVADQAGATDIIPRHAYTPAGAAWFEARGRYFRTPKRGDIVFYRFPSMNRISHVGIVETVHSDGSITAIEGNTNAAGSRTGGRVMRKRRSRSLVAGFGHPAYVSAAQLEALRKAEATARAKRVAAARVAAAKAKRAAEARARKAAAAAKRKKKGPSKAVKVVTGVVVVIGGTGTVVAVNEAPRPTPRPAVTASSTPSPHRTPYAPPTTSLPPVPKLVLTRTLTVRRPVMRGSDVAAVRRLIGVRTGTLYTPLVAQAVARWQKANGLKPDGQWGPASARRAGWRIP